MVDKHIVLWVEQCGLALIIGWLIAGMKKTLAFTSLLANYQSSYTAFF